MFRLLCLITVSIFIWQHCIAQYVNQKSEYRFYLKIRHLSTELVQDAEMKCSGIDKLKQTNKGIHLEMGQVTYRIRSNLRRMLVLYIKELRLIDDDHDKEEQALRVSEIDSLARETLTFLDMMEVREIERNRSDWLFRQEQLAKVRRSSFESKSARKIWQDWQRAVESEEMKSKQVELSLRNKNKANKKGGRRNGVWKYKVLDPFVK